MRVERAIRVRYSLVVVAVAAELGTIDCAPASEKHRISTQIVGRNIPVDALEADVIPTVVGMVVFDADVIRDASVFFDRPYDGKQCDRCKGSDYCSLEHWLVSPAFR
jgi:hypothetical protein